MIADAMLALALRDQVAAEVRHNGTRDTACHVTLCLANGTVLQRAAGFMPLDLARREWARLTCARMNRPLMQGGVRQGGAWVVAWCEPVSAADRTPTRVLFLWKDADGDTPVVFDCQARFDEMVAWGPDWPLAHATEALRRYGEHLRNLSLRPEHMIKAAQGETAYDPKTGRAVDASRIVLDPLAAAED